MKRNLDHDGEEEGDSIGTASGKYGRRWEQDMWIGWAMDGNEEG